MKTMNTQKIRRNNYGRSDRAASKAVLKKVLITEKFNTEMLEKSK